MNNFNKLLLGLLVTVSFSTTASAQWHKDSSVDNFTGESVEIISNQGQVISGPQGSTTLIYRKRNNLEELYWATPESYICRTGWSVQMRLDDGKPQRMSVSPSTSNTSIFFNSFDRIFIDIFKAEKIALLLQDGCGTRLVSEFTGNALEFFPDVARFSQLNEWSFDPKLGSVGLANENLQINYRRIVTGDHDLSFKVTDQQFADSKASKKFRKGKIIFDGSEYKAKVYPGGEYGGKMDGTFKVFFDDKTVVNDFVEAMKNDLDLKVIIAKSEYELSISGFSDAERMIK